MGDKVSGARREGTANGTIVVPFIQVFEMQVPLEPSTVEAVPSLFAGREPDLPIGPSTP